MQRERKRRHFKAELQDTKMQLVCRNPAPACFFSRNAAIMLWWHSSYGTRNQKQKWMRRYEGIDLRNEPAVSAEAIKRIAPSWYANQPTEAEDPAIPPARIALCRFQTKSNAQTGPSPTQQSPFETALLCLTQDFWCPLQLGANKWFSLAAPRDSLAQFPHCDPWFLQYIWPTSSDGQRPFQCDDVHKCKLSALEHNRGVGARTITREMRH